MNYVSLYNETNGDFNNLTVTGDVDLSSATIIVDSIKFGDGSETNPSITFVNDTDTGLYLQNTNTVSVTTGGIETLRLNNIDSTLTSNFNVSGQITVNYNIIGNSGAVIRNDVEVTNGDVVARNDILVDNNVYIQNQLILENTFPALCFNSDLTTGLFRGGVNTLSIASNNSEVARFNDSQIQFYRNVAMGNNTLNCGSISSGTFSVTCGSIISSGSFTNGTNSITCGSITSSGTISNGTNSMTCGALSCTSLLSSGTISNGTNSMTCGALSCTSLLSSGTISNGTNAMTCGSLSSRAINSGTFGITCGAITSSGTISNGTNAMTCGNLSSGSVSAGTNSVSCGSGFCSGIWTVGKSSPSIATGYNRLQLYGNANSSTGPHIQAFTNSDDYPVTQHLNYAHDNSVICFDCYWDGTWRSSYASSNFQIQKTADFLNINYFTGGAQGSSISGIVFNRALRVSNVGQVTIANLSAGAIVGPSSIYINNTVASSNGAGRLQIQGTASSNTLSPSILLYFTDGYPGLQLMPYSHDTVELNFDCYRNGSTVWGSGSTNSNFQISKSTSTLSNRYASGIAQGSAITWNNGTVLNTSGQFSIGNTIINTGAQKLMVYGTDNSSNGPHIQTFTSADNYPLFQVQSQQHNQVKLNFDMYWDGTNLLSSNSSSNFQLGKSSNQFQVITGSGNAQGAVATLAVASYWDTTGNFVCNQNITGAKLSLTSQPCLMMSASTYISVSTATHTLFNGFDTQDYSTGSIGFGSGSTMTVPSTGVYLITFEMSFDSSVSTLGVWYQMYLKKNGSGAYGQQLVSITTGTQFYLTSSVQMRLITSDTIELYVYQNTGASLHIGSVSNGVARIEFTKLF